MRNDSMSTKSSVIVAGSSRVPSADLTPPSTGCTVADRMPYLLAKLGEAAVNGRRHIWFRGGWHEGAVAGAAASLPAGAVVFLAAEAPPWLDAVPQPNREPWPQWMPAIQDLKARPHTLETVEDLGSRISVSGRFTLDDRERPCELGEGRQGVPAVVLNYAGWRLFDLGSARCQALAFHVDGRVVWVLPPSCVGLPAADAGARSAPGPAPPVAAGRNPALLRAVANLPAPERLAGPLMNGGLSRTANLDRAAQRMSEPGLPSARPRQVDVVVRFSTVDFDDGRLSVLFEAAPVVALAPWSRAVFNEIRGAFDAELPDGVRIRGVVHGDGTRDLKLEGLDPLGRTFFTLWIHATARRARRTRQWCDAEALAREAPGVDGVPSPIDLFDDDAFALGSRRQTFRALYEARHPGAPVLVLPGHGFLVPLAAKGDEPLLYAWETVDSQLATYLFRPLDEEARERMLDWTAQAGARRMDLLRDPALQAATGFLGRVFHPAGAGSLERWWRAVDEAR